jgi:hypothetical protein
MMISRLFLITVALLSLTGCGTRLFHANFDSEPVGMPPSASPPGDPAGDRIFIPSLASFPPPPLPVLLVNAHAAFSGNAAMYLNTDLPYREKSVSFFSIESTSASEQYWAAWTGALAGESPLEIWLFVGHYQLVCKLRFQAGQLQVLTRIAPERYETLAPLTPGFTKHLAVIRFDKPTSRYSLTVLPARGGPGPGVPIVSGSRPAVGFDVDVRQPPGLHLAFPENANSGYSSYTIDNIVITEACPHELPTGDGDTVMRYDCS